MKKNEKTDIIMTGWQREQMTNASLEAIRTRTETPYGVTLILNEGFASTPFNSSLYNINNLILMRENMGLEYAKNRGMGFVKSKYFISTDNDILPMQPDKDGDWLSKLIKLMDENPKYGAISCRTQIMIGSGNIFDGKEDQDIVEFPHPGGSLRIMRTDLVKEVGGWRDNEPLRGSEEKYICGRLREKGYKTGFAVKVKCWHLFGDDKNWGYGSVKPKDHGHGDIGDSLPGDDYEEIEKWLNPKS